MELSGPFIWEGPCSGACGGTLPYTSRSGTLHQHPQIGPDPRNAPRSGTSIKESRQPPSISNCSIDIQERAVQPASKDVECTVQQHQHPGTQVPKHILQQHPAHTSLWSGTSRRGSKAETAAAAPAARLVDGVKRYFPPEHRNHECPTCPTPARTVFTMIYAAFFSLQINFPPLGQRFRWGTGIHCE